MMKLPSDQGFVELVDLYLDGQIEASGLAQLEEALQASAAARAFFAEYAALDAQMRLAARARQMGDRALRLIATPKADFPRPWTLLRRAGVAGLVAACVVGAVMVGWWLRRPAGHGGAIAWLANAQDCRWVNRPVGDLRAGQMMDMEAGLVEIRFASGASAVLEGPAKLELLSGNGARLVAGKLAAHVPGPAHGFAVELPQGRVVDLGTEFGAAVGADGSADVRVFEGKIQTFAAGGQEMDLRMGQAAHVGEKDVTLLAGEGPAIVRAIGGMREAHTLTLDFKKAAGVSLRDRNGLATGLTTRLEGTGRRLVGNDENLLVDEVSGTLQIMTTKSDINTQSGMDVGEYPGVRLGALGFTGPEDFEISVIAPDIPPLEAVGQFGLFAGTKSDENIRGGLISTVEQDHYRAFLVNNEGGRDADLNVIGLLATGTDLRLTLRRMAGQYTLTVENLTQGNASTLAIRPPALLDGEKDLCVGVFGANTQSDVRTTLKIRQMKVTVWGSARE